MPRKTSPDNRIISIHAPTRGATMSTNLREQLYQFQSTLPQGERRISESTVSHKPIISIHAPTRGATRFFILLTIRDFISIHAPTRGATVVAWIEFDAKIISIHAPTRGATAIFPNFRPCITLNIPKFYQYHSFFLIICS